jgi:hypothetical protein
MANEYITPTVIARTAVATLYNTLVLAQLVWRDFDSDFAGKQGNSINIRKPAVFTAEEFDRSKGVTTQTITEDDVPLTLDTIANVTVAVTDEEMTLDIADFSSQILAPAMEAVAQKVDADLAEALADNASEAGQVTSGSGETANAALREAREKLTRNKYPSANRYAVVSPEGTSELLSDKLLVAVDQSGASAALREANVGRVFGIDTYESQVFGQGGQTKGEFDGVAFHKTAVTLAVRPLVTPKGVAASQVAVENYKSLSLRTVYDYNHNKKQDEVSVDLLYGIADTRDDAAVELDFGQGS